MRRVVAREPFDVPKLSVATVRFDHCDEQWGDRARPIGQLGDVAQSISAAERAAGDAAAVQPATERRYAERRPNWVRARSVVLRQQAVFRVYAGTDGESVPQPVPRGSERLSRLQLQHIGRAGTAAAAVQP